MIQNEVYTNTETYLPVANFSTYKDVPMDMQSHAISREGKTTTFKVEILRAWRSWLLCEAERPLIVFAEQFNSVRRKQCCSAHGATCTWQTPSSIGILSGPP